jgi:hypothetical protein
LGIPRKGSRKVTVFTREYLYVIKETHVPEHLDQKELSVTVQEDVEKPGRVCQWRWAYGFNYSPEDVRQTIVKAIEAGWNPSARGAAFFLTNC